MAELPLLKMKLQPPPAAAVVRRLRLLQQLDRSLQAPVRLALVCAPAGYGKTTLASEWAAAVEARGELQVCWLTLDPGDSDLARFLRYLVAALQRVQPGLGAEALAMLGLPRPPAAAALATVLCAELAGAQARLALVLDDYHLLDSGPVHELVAMLVEQQPHLLVIASRADPPLPLARLRARGQLVEIRQSDLAFTRPEAADFLAARLGSDLPPEALAVLEQRTEGWAAGLQLAAVSLRAAPDAEAYLQAFSGRQQYVADYLVAEVLAQQPQRVQAFLLQTAILERLSAGLCAAVTGQEDAGQTLETLLHANLFITPADPQGEWFRYHGLLADLLRKRLLERDAQLVPELHRRASAWYRRNGLAAPAVEHALAAEDFPEAAEIMCAAAGQVLMQGETFTFLRWMQAMPPEQLAASQMLCVYYGLALLMASRAPGPALSLLPPGPEAGRSSQVEGGLATVLALQAVVGGQPAEAIRHAGLALELLPAEQAFLRSLAADSLGMGQTLLGETAAAAAAFEQASAAAAQAGNQPLALLTLSNLAGLHYLHGHLRAAEAAFRQILERAGGRSQATGKALLGLGEIARERGELEQARQDLHAAGTALQPITGFGGPMVALALARVAWARGQREQAANLLEQARQQALASTTTQLDDRLVDSLQARFWIAEGRLDPARDWAVEQGLLDPDKGEPLLPPPGRPADDLLQGNALTLAHLLLAQGRPEPAQPVLERALATAEQRGHGRRVIEILALLALAQQARGAADRALETLARALALGEPEGYLQTFVEAGPALAPLLRRAAADGDNAEYARRLLAVMPETDTSPSQVGLVEPLSERELEVLQLLNEGLSNQQIADRLFITLSTVKGHTSNVYGKLGVRNRSQAAAAARQLGLVE